MRMELEVRNRLVRNGLLSLFLYALPVVAMFLVFFMTGQKPWLSPPEIPTGAWYQMLKSTSGNGLIVFILALGLVELVLGLYGKRWDRNEKTLDFACFVIPKLVIRPLIAWVSLRTWPALFPGMQGNFAFVPFVWGFLIICVADDLTQYWYHRLHHEVPFLWRFHRTHHSAPYMGVSVTSRQNLLYTLFFFADLCDLDSRVPRARRSCDRATNDQKSDHYTRPLQSPLGSAILPLPRSSALGMDFGADHLNPRHSPCASFGFFH